MMQQEIKKQQVKFRVLDDWDILFIEDGYIRQVSINPLENKAFVRSWGDGLVPADYILHEMLHIAIRAAVRKGYEGEELLVQDLCVLFGEQ